MITLKKILNLGFLLLLSPLSAHSAPLTEAQQLQMYRECRVTYADKNKYFAKKMCGCIVQAYLHDVPPAQSALKCLDYAKNN